MSRVLSPFLHVRGVVLGDEMASHLLNELSEFLG
jgi:hypothetical protein